MLSWFSSTATIPTGGFPSSAGDAGGYGGGGDANGGASFRGKGYPRYVAEDGYDEQGRRQAREDDVFEPSAAAAAAAAAERMEGVDLGIHSGTDVTRRKSGGSGDGGGLLVGGGGGGSDAPGASAGTGASGNPEVEARLRVISAAMHAVLAALSALSALPESGGGGLQGGVTANSHGGEDLEGAAASSAVCDGSTSLGDEATMGVGDPHADDCGGRAQSHNGSVASASAVAVAAASVPPPGARNGASVAAKNAGPQHSRAESVVVDQASPHNSKGEEGMGQGAPASAGTPAGLSGAAAAPEVVGVGAAAAAAAVYGRELARAAGTPTVDAIGGDVHLVATVAGKRSLTRLLHFVDLVRAWGRKERVLNNVKYVGRQRQMLGIERTTARQPSSFWPRGAKFCGQGGGLSASCRDRRVLNALHMSTSAARAVVLVHDASTGNYKHHILCNGSDDKRVLATPTNEDSRLPLFPTRMTLFAIFFVHPNTFLRYQESKGRKQRRKYANVVLAPSFVIVEGLACLPEATPLSRYNPVLVCHPTSRI